MNTPKHLTWFFCVLIWLILEKTTPPKKKKVYPLCDILRRKKKKPLYKKTGFTSELLHIVAFMHKVHPSKRL